MGGRKTRWLFFSFLLLSLTVSGTTRPFIWVKPQDRGDLLRQIAEVPGKKAYYRAFLRRLAPELAAHERDPQAYLLNNPFTETLAPDGHPVFRTFTEFSGEERDAENVLRHKLLVAIDCGVAYFLTEDERYARLAADVLHTFVRGLQTIEPAWDTHNGGWLYRKDHLREAREIGAQIPIIYDFVHPYLLTGAKVYDLATKQRVPFSFPATQDVFRAYARLVREQGIIDCNWPVLEAPSLVHNTLALDDPRERTAGLRYFLTENTENQDALPKMAAEYDAHGGDWPESTNYSQGVAGRLVYLFALLHKYDAGYDLARRYPQPLADLPKTYYLTYPDGDQILIFGDGHRPYHAPIARYEQAYHLGQITENRAITDQFGSLIKSEVENSGYRRHRFRAERELGPTAYLQPLTLLWDEPEVTEQAGRVKLPVTDELSFAGITLQRNPSPTGKAEDALMGFIGGGHYVHGHATGMNIELWGEGMVMGTKGGRGDYRTDLHENYYRLFAANNTVITNGASQGNGGWVNLGINTVEQLAVEPLPEAAPLSPNHSFSIGYFRDDRGEGAEAEQQRTLGIVRTGPTSGFYVDIFRSRSAVAEPYHDYVYHNVGEEVRIDLTADPTPDRYRANTDAPWRRNRAYRNPGWHFFTDVRTSPATRKGTRAVFTAAKPGPEERGMQVLLPAGPLREYTTAQAPPANETPPYAEEPLPTLVVRQPGQAWEEPFLAVFEPFSAGDARLQSVEELGRGRGCNAWLLKSGKRRYLVLSGDGPDATLSLPEHQLSFTGRYAVVTLNQDGEPVTFYLGEGKNLLYRGWQLTSDSEAPVAALATRGASGPTVRATAAAQLVDPAGKIIKALPE